MLLCDTKQCFAGVMHWCWVHETCAV